MTAVRGHASKGQWWQMLALWSSVLLRQISLMRLTVLPKSTTTSVAGRCGQFERP